MSSWFEVAWFNIRETRALVDSLKYMDGKRKELQNDRDLKANPCCTIC
jgi:hypothetical protein